MANLLPFFIISLIWVGSVLISSTPYLVIKPDVLWKQYMLIATFIPSFIISFVVISGLLSRFAQKGIIRGKFPSEPFHPVYFLRRIYGACWTQLYYFKPLYAIVLAIPILRKLTFRLFGYKESCEFVVYPDTWIRDLPVLKIGKGAYLSNRATIGTNICLSDGNILVDQVLVEDGGLVGHLTMLAPGAKIGNKTEIGVGVAIGIRSRIFANAKVNPGCVINHGAVVGEGAEVGTHSYVGIKATIGKNIKIPGGANIPAGAIIETQDDVNKYFNSETDRLRRRKTDLEAIFGAV